MANVIGEAAVFAQAELVRGFKRILLACLVAIALCGVLLGLPLSLLFSIRQLPLITLVLIFALAGAVLVTTTNWLMRRAGQFEKARLSWRRGAQGELSVGALLAALPDSFYVFNDVTFGFGNVDHIVIGPTGIFAVEVKACRSVVTSDSGEVNLNGERQSWIPKLHRNASLRNGLFLVGFDRGHVAHAAVAHVWQASAKKAPFGLYRRLAVSKIVWQLSVRDCG